MFEKIYDNIQINLIILLLKMKISRILDKKLLQEFFFFLNKWFDMMYIRKDLGVERHLTHKCNVFNAKLKRQKWELFYLHHDYNIYN